MFFKKLFIRFPSLRSLLNLRTNISALSFITCSVPLFFMGHVTMGLALALGSISCGLADTSSVTKYRIVDYLISIPLFFIIALGVTIVFPYSILFCLSLAIVSFVFFMLAALSPRLGSIGFASLLLAVYAMLLHHNGQPIWQIPLWLTLGSIWYVLWQCLAIYFLPNQESKDILSDLYQILAKKLMVHDEGFLFTIDKSQLFIKSGHYRSQIASLSGTLRHRVHQQYIAGEGNEESNHILHFTDIAEKVSEQTRLMYFSPSTELKTHCPEWMDAIHQANKKISQYLSEVTVNNVKKIPSPTIDFSSLREYSTPNIAKEDALAAQTFINKLDIIYLLLQQLKTQFKPNETMIRPSKTLIGSWKWSEVSSKLTSQLTLKSSYFRHALRGTLCLTTGLILVRVLSLEFGFWTLMTSLLVLRPNLSTTWTRLLQRITGTISGLVIVYAMLQFQVSSGWLFLVFCVSSVLFFHTSAHKYGIAVFFVTLFVFSGFSLNGEGNIIMLPRLENTLLGVFLPLLFVFIIAPGWNKKSFPTQLQTTIQGYVDYLDGLKRYIEKTDENTDDVINLNYKNCVVNDTNLFDHWMGYLGEPHLNSQTGESILLCSRSSNIILRIITRLNENRGQLLTDYALESSIKNTIELLTEFQLILKQMAFQPNFFELIKNKETSIYQTLSHIENHMDRLDDKALLELVSNKLKHSTQYTVSVE